MCGTWRVGDMCTCGQSGLPRLAVRPMAWVCICDDDGLVIHVGCRSVPGLGGSSEAGLVRR